MQLEFPSHLMLHSSLDLKLKSLKVYFLIMAYTALTIETKVHDVTKSSYAIPAMLVSTTVALRLTLLFMVLVKQAMMPV